MSTSTPLDESVSARLDGELDDAAWAAVVASHGAAAEQALERARELQLALGQLPLPTPPPELMARLQGDARKAATAATDPMTGRAAKPGDRWWAWGGAAALAACLAAALVPLALGQMEPEPGAAAAPVVARLDQEAAGNGDGYGQSGGYGQGGGGGFDQGSSADDRPAAARVAQPAPTGQVASRDAASAGSEVSALVLTRGEAGPAPAATPAPGPSGLRFGDQAEDEAMATSDEFSPNDAPETAQSEADIADGFADLVAEAKRFRQHRDAGSSPGAPPPDAVLEEALAAERRALGDDKGDRLQLNLALAIDRSEAELPLIAITLANTGEVTLPLRAELLEVEGLDADGTVVWRLDPPVPTTALEPGRQLDWAAPLTVEELPPATVTGMRLRYGPVVSEETPVHEGSLGR